MSLTRVSNSLVNQLTGQKGEKFSQNYDIAAVLDAFGASVLSHHTGLEVAEGGEIRRYYRKETPTADNLLAEIAEDSEEVYFLTQVILNTLNTQPDWFHDMVEIPGLELESREQVTNITDYLTAQGWIEAKAADKRLLVKLTIKGKLYLCNNNAWS